MKKALVAELIMGAFNDLEQIFTTGNKLPDESILAGMCAGSLGMIALMRRLDSSLGYSPKSIQDICAELRAKGDEEWPNE